MYIFSIIQLMVESGVCEICKNFVQTAIAIHPMALGVAGNYICATAI